MFPELSRPSFSGHETFSLRYAWLKKARDAVDEDPEIFLAEDAMVRLGVGKNMVKAIRHWGLATGVLAEGDTLEGSRVREILISKLGNRLFGKRGWDPYLEDPATLWVLHWQLASTPDRSTTWYWLFNHQPTPDFTIDSVVRSLQRLAAERGWPRLTAASLKRDVDCCIRTYFTGRKTARAVLEDTLDCPLAELGLIRRGPSKDVFLLTREPRPSLSGPVFAYALAEYLENHGHPGSVLLEDLMHQPGAPGRVFRMTEDDLLHRVEELRDLTEEAVLYDETAGLKQIRLQSAVDPTAMLQAHYKRQRTQRRAG